MSEQTFTMTIAGKDVQVSTGKMAHLAHGAITLQMGGTVLFATASVDSKDSDLDYFPLSVEYIEKMYASGQISSSRFQKREGRPSDEATIKAREVDHSIRSLFPKSFKRPVSVVLTVLAYDGENDPQALTVLGTSLALLQSGVPFAGPCASVVVSLDETNTISLNPPANEREDDTAEFIVSGVDGKILSFEGWGKEIPESLMDEVLDKADEAIRHMNAQQKDIVAQLTPSLEIDAELYTNEPAPREVIDTIKSNFGDAIKKAMFAGSKASRDVSMDPIKDEIVAFFEEQGEEAPEKPDIFAAIDYVSRATLRAGVLEEGKRVSGRQLDEIRPLSAEIDVLPTVHGSALFTRGLTQSLSIVTLGPKSGGLMIDDMEGEDVKHFMHHYNFPSFSVGEAGRYRYYPGRREVGHGAIGENALMYMLPDTDDFPYTVRAVSEIMTSNGSTSMAATCASSMALMAAGVPMKEQVAGIGVGLVTNDSDANDYKLLLDIEGIEDFYGDMDFKVTGTKNGITAIQYENKLQGVPIAILKEAFRLAREGREQVLAVMNDAIATPKGTLPANAPKVETVMIKQDEIADLIGPGGKNIKELVESSKKFSDAPADIAIEQDGRVIISSVNGAQMDFVKETIAKMFEKPEVGRVYTGKVAKVEKFGFFVDVTKNISGLCHVSKIPGVQNVGEHFKEGDTVQVKVEEIDNRGRTNFTMEGVPQA